jgi:hydroxylaminobenzene mutase
MTPLDHASRRLMQHGLIVFLLGLGSGLAMVTPAELFANPRLALSAHLVGVSTGMFLILAGLLMERVTLSPAERTATVWLAAYGAYGNWGGTIVGAIYGTQALTKIASAGTSALEVTWPETAVTILLTTSGFAAIAACGMLLWGLRSPKA